VLAIHSRVRKRVCLSVENSGSVRPNDPQGPGALNLGIEKMAETCVQGRGVMVDLFSRYGADRKLVGYDELTRIFEEDGVVVDESDIFLRPRGLDRSGRSPQGEPRR
jgi:hypothetical protein